MAKPPLELAVEVTGATGTQHRWGPGPLAANIPQGLSFRTKQAEGFADAAVTLARRIDREYVDLNLLDDVVISGADGSIAYEGRVTALPRSMQDTHQVTVQITGWMSHTRDRKAQEIYVDRDISAWGDMSATRRAALIGTSLVTIGDTSNSSDFTGAAAALRLTINGPWSGTNGFRSQSWYDAGPVARIGNVYYDWVAGANVPGAGNWLWDITSFNGDDASGSGPTSGNLNGLLTGAQYLDIDSRRYVAAEFGFGVAGGSAITYDLTFRKTAVYGDHELPLIGDTDPKGVAASDVIRHLIAKYCPKLNTNGVQATTYPIPHLVFKDRTDPYDVLLAVNAYHLWQLGVYDNRTVNYWPIDMSDYDWEVRLSDHGTSVELQGDSISDLANGIVVQYQNVATGRPDVLTPDTYPELRDAGDSNPATLAGIEKWTEISLSSPSTQEAALQIGRAALAEFNQPKAPGTINVHGHIRDRAGHWQPVWKVRSGDRIVISDHANDRARLVVETDYQHDSKTVSIAVDSSFKRLDAVLDRLGTALGASGLN